MSDKNMTGSIALTKLIHVKKKGKTGQDCLVIPINDNILEVDEKDNVYLPVRIVYKPEGDQYKQNGFVAKSIPSKIYKSASEEEKKAFEDKTPILGSIKDWSTGGSTEPNNAKPGVVLEEGDDLPF